MPRAPIAVYDTSTRVAPESRIALVTAAANLQCDAWWSPWIIAELNRVLTERWLLRAWKTGTLEKSVRWDTEHRNMSRLSKIMMRWMIGPIRCYDAPAPNQPSWRGADPDDEPVLALAKEVHANYVVSENTRHFPPRTDGPDHEYEGIVYVQVADFLSRLGSVSPTPTMSVE